MKMLLGRFGGEISLYLTCYNQKFNLNLRKFHPLTYVIFQTVMSCCSSLVQADYGQSDGDEFVFGSDPDDVISDLLGVRFSCQELSFIEILVE